MTELEKSILFNDVLETDDSDLFGKLLIAHPECKFHDDGRDYWLSSAAHDGRLNIVKLLVSLGANVNDPSNPSDSGPSPEGAIEYAANRGHLDVVRYLLDHGAIVNHMVNGRIRCQALVGAVIWGHLEVAKMLVERGADVNAIWAQMTPLDRAIQHMRPEIEEYLRSVGGKTAMEVDPEAATPPKKKGRGKR